MNSNIYTKYFLLYLIFTSTNSYAQKINPSDVTAVRTAVTTQVYDDYSGNLTLDMSGSYNKDLSYMIQAKGDWNDDFELKATRYQFYNLIATGSKYIPRTGISLDYLTMYEDVDTIDVKMYAVGSVSYIPLSDNVMFAPQIAYLESTFNIMDNNPLGFKSGNYDASGVLFAGYFSQRIFDDGTFVMIWPEYYKLSGDNIEYEDRMIKTTWGAPITKDRTWWYMIQYEVGNNRIEVNNRKIQSKSNKISLKIRFYF